MKRHPYRYCQWCEEKICTETWRPYCSQFCTETAIRKGWDRLKGKP